MPDSRIDGRAADALRPVRITTGFVPTAHGSALIEMGGTRVICTASVEESVPGWRRGSGLGWVTAEYGMLPASTGARKARDISRGKLDGRSSEIQRLIGRALRAVVNLEALGERTVWLDCDVLTADGGTRCASICGAYVALEHAVAGLLADGKLRANPLHEPVAAVSVGVVDGVPMLDLCYAEDSRADADANVVMTASDGIVEVQASAEGALFAREVLDRLMDLAHGGIRQLLEAQRAAGAAA
ncbi:MAG TPA: ribonuclease PH [Miltoncostaeaceae bacterium]|nr:ribonuclease PH [Miltoncostaeaceae bacterium]